MCVLLRRALHVSECEIARVYEVVHPPCVPGLNPLPLSYPAEPTLSFPPAPSTKPSLTANEFFSDHEELMRKVVDLKDEWTGIMHFASYPRLFVAAVMFRVLFRTTCT